MKIGKLLRKFWPFSWPKVISRTLILWGVRLLGGCVYYAEYGIHVVRSETISCGKWLIPYYYTYFVSFSKKHHRL